MTMDVILLGDSTWPGNDHTREYVPQLAYSKEMHSVNLGELSTFGDLG
jgi:phosphopentomutase